MRARLAQLTVALLALAPGLAFSAPHLEIHGTSHFDARSTHTRDSVAITATLLDDAERPIAAAHVRARFTSEEGHVLPALACSTTSDEETSEQTTDLDGTFCARALATQPPGTVTATLTFAGTKLLAPTEREESIDPTRATVTLAFDPEAPIPRVLMLAEGALEVDAVVTVDEPDASVARLPLELDLDSGVANHGGASPPRKLADAITDARGRARFFVPEASLGTPGTSLLRIAFAGDRTHVKASHEMACETRVRVVVNAHKTESPSPAHPHQSESARALVEETEEGASLDVDAVTLQGASVPGGSVEALLDGAVVSATPVTDGHAHVTIPRLSHDGQDAIDALARETPDATPRFAVRYVPDAPWYVASPPTTLTLHFRRQTLVWRGGVLALGGVLLAWFFLSRSRFFALPPGLAKPPRPARRPDTAHIDLLNRHADGRATWEGRVVDAHDGTPVVGAVVTLERAGFGVLEPLVQQTTDTDGRFVLTPPPSKADAGQPAQIVAEAPFHARLAQRAPAHGVIEVALVTRRRAILRRFVEWAKRRAGLFPEGWEPTPGGARRSVPDRSTAHWAETVEQAAFGPGEVDAAREAEIDRLGHKGG